MTTEPRIKKRMAAAGLAAGLLGGGAVGFAFTGSTFGAGAQTASTTTPTTTAPGSNGSAANGGPAATRPDPTKRLGEVLKPLVDKGTITQAQADAVIGALEAAGPAGGFGGRGGPGGPGRRAPGMGGLDAAAKALGVTTDQLRTDLASGKTIADIAKTKNVDIATVINALVNDEKTRLADAVKSGRLTQAEADQRIAGITDRITKQVNNTLPAPPAGGGMGADGHGPWGRRGDQGAPPADGNVGSTTAPSTSAPDTTAPNTGG